MTTEEMVETLIQNGIKAYKKLNKNTREATLLNQQKEVEIEGINFSCWREYAVYKTGEQLQELLPYAKVQVNLDKNNSSLELEIDDTEQKKVNAFLYSFLKSQKLV